MDTKMCAVIIGIVAGAIGYWFTTFSIQPILRFRNYRNQVLMDFILYAQVINADGLNNDMEQLHQERTLSNLRTSAQLSAAILDLPSWYLLYLKLKKLNPNEAAKHLIGYSSTTDYEQANKIEGLIRRLLGLPKKT